MSGTGTPGAGRIAWLLAVLLAILIPPAAAGAQAFEHCAALRQQSGSRAYLECVANTARSGPGNSARCDREEARINIDWVFTDVGATRTFQSLYDQGRSPLDAVIGAQAHNPNAQQSIRNCAGWAAEYIASRYAAAIRGVAGGSAGGRPERPEACIAPANGPCAGCQVSCAPGDAAYCRQGSPMGFPANPPSCAVPASCVCSVR